MISLLRITPDDKSDIYNVINPCDNCDICNAKIVLNCLVLSLCSSVIKFTPSAVTEQSP